jgi:hypothetical protein
MYSSENKICIVIVPLSHFLIGPPPWYTSSPLPQSPLYKSSQPLCVTSSLLTVSLPYLLTTLQSHLFTTSLCHLLIVSLSHFPIASPPHHLTLSPHHCPILHFLTAPLPQTYCFTPQLRYMCLTVTLNYSLCVPLTHFLTAHCFAATLPQPHFPTAPLPTASLSHWPASSLPHIHFYKSNWVFSHKSSSLQSYLYSKSTRWCQWRPLSQKFSSGNPNCQVFAPNALGREVHPSLDFVWLSLLRKWEPFKFLTLTQRCRHWLSGVNNTAELLTQWCQ